MEPSQKSNKRGGGDDEGQRDIRRQRTDDAYVKEEDSEDPTPEPVAPATGSANAIAVAVAVTLNININNNNNDDDDELPSTPFELTEVLCTIVSDRYSRDEKLRTLERLLKWANTARGDFLKSFHVCNGIWSVSNFIKKTMNDGNCVGQVRMESIEKAANIIAISTYAGRNKVNLVIAKKIARSVTEFDGINTLINASEEYTGGDDVTHLKALCMVWSALRNIYVMEVVISKDQVITLFDAGIDVISQLKSVDDVYASYTLRHVFRSLYNIVWWDNYVIKKHFQDKDILSKCLEVFKKDNGTWTCRSKIVMAGAIEFFNQCHDKLILKKSSDYEKLLPLLIMVLKKHPSNNTLRNCAFEMIDGACSTANDRKIIVGSGVMEVLGSLLTSDNINEGGKQRVLTVIRRIIAS
jgi:hypothetical protein